VYGPELVGRLEAYITAVAQGLDAVPPTIDAADIQQQLVMEVLIAADRLPIPSQPQWVPRQLILRASREVARWLARETANATVSLNDRPTAGTNAPIGSTFPPSATIDIREDDLTLLHRFYVLGESGKDLASEFDLSAPALRRRVSRAADRCRDSVQSRTQQGHKGRRGTQKGRPPLSHFNNSDGQLRKDGARTTNIPRGDSAGPGRREAR
jgi:hypothetical protein